MANILEKYGIKEVADVTFYKITSAGLAGAPVLYLDTLKVSTTEQAAENADAKGGKGNSSLISWDYGRDITVTLEDALFSAKSFQVMFGDTANAFTTETVKKTLAFTATGTTAAACGAPTSWEGPDGTSHAITTPKYYDAATGAEIATADGVVVVGDSYFITFDVTVSNAVTVDITANKFPGTYYVTGDTYARSQSTGEDEFFQFIIPKAKVLSEDISITMEADGDPSTFQMKLKVLRNSNSNGKGMMQLVKYGVAAGTDNNADEGSIWD